MKFESHSGKQTTLALACIATGLTLAVGFRHFDGSGMTNSLAGFLLGILLLLIGLPGILVSGKQTIIVDYTSRSIYVEDTNWFWSKKRTIPFGDIIGTSIGYFGKKSNYVNFYYIILKLKNGEKYPLFAPGLFFEGGDNRSVMEARRRGLEEYIHAGIDPERA